ncbi:16540_t:CDS:2 [Entrophospora sp. SA101]|nr:16540_t:CDS:2 [Entrophospora sp. SA101]
MLYNSSSSSIIKENEQKRPKLTTDNNAIEAPIYEILKDDEFEGKGNTNLVFELEDVKKQLMQSENNKYIT